MLLGVRGGLARCFVYLLTAQEESQGGSISPDRGGGPCDIATRGRFDNSSSNGHSSGTEISSLLSWAGAFRLTPSGGVDL